MARNQAQVLIDMLGNMALKLAEMTARAETAEAMLEQRKAKKAEKPVEKES